MHLRVNETLLEHHAENQQEDAENRDAAKLVRICRTEDATDLIATEKDLHFFRKQFLICQDDRYFKGYSRLFICEV